MGTPNPDMPLLAPDPTSEAGSGQAPVSRAEDPWRAILELQSRNMAQLIEAIKTPNTTSPAICLPEFNPDLPDCNALAWSNTVDLCLAEKPLQGGSLIIALSKALKGSAATWLSQISYAGMTWLDFKSLLISRFEVIKTVSASLIHLQNGQPKDGESIATYASRLVTTLTSKWNNLSVEQIAISTVLAHVSKFDSHAYRLAFTSQITDRHKLQQELSILPPYKRKWKSDFCDNSESTESKRFKPAGVVCHFCGISGHKSINCRKKLEKFKQYSSSSSSYKPAPKKIICFRCGESGHVAPRCPNASGKPPGGSSGAAGSQSSGRQPTVKE